MAKCERKGALTAMESAPYEASSWSIMLASSRMRQSCVDRPRTRLVVPLDRIGRFSLCAYNNKRVRASETFTMLAICINCIDCKYLRRNEVNACTQCRELKIRQVTGHLLNHRRSSWRRRHINIPPSGRLIVLYSLFRQGKVRMSSTKGRHLLSP